MYQQVTESDKEIAAILLATGLFVVFAKTIYEYFFHERFTLFNLLHPVKPIAAKERQFIANYVEPFGRLSPSQRRKFLKRFAWFKSKKHFVFYGDIKNKDKIKAYVSASAILVTLGLDNYRFEKSISRVIIYPSHFYSRIGRNHHIGEYNPRLRILVFSAESLKEGFEIPNDNVNLGIHEVAHALMVEFATKSKSSWEAKKFKAGLLKIKKLFESEEFKKELTESIYFRTYGQTSFVEFFAVAIESFVETPEQFKLHFPRLFEIVRILLNFDLSNPNWKFKNSL